MSQDLAEPGTDSVLPTRQSLLSRLQDCQDQEGWREFFDAYWRLIYNVARKAGLNELQAQEVVQNTLIYLSRRLPKFRYDRSRGSFKCWLRVVTRSRINVYCRTEKANQGAIREPLRDECNEGPEGVEAWADPAADALDQVWQHEWEENLLSAAYRKVRSKVTSRQLLIFRTAMQSELSASQVAKKLGINVAQVYLARHRVGRLLKAEVERLRREME